MTDKLIEPSPILIQQRNRAATVVNTREREPVRQVSRNTEIELEAQVSEGKSASTQFKFGGQGGQSNRALGYLVFLRAELIAKGITLDMGDRVTSIAGIPRNFYLTAQFFAGHRNGAPTLEFWDYSDYEPGKVV